RLVFPYSNGTWEGGLPSVRPEPGNTVWGAVFEIPAKHLAELNAVEAEEGRIPTEDFKAVDREGHRHPVLTHVHNGSAGSERTPSREYMRLVVEGGRHWKLPAGWVAGLEEYVEEPLF
ncbi:MAG: gamma-glutamylcyclotransferase family protein, partial [Acidimicrobiia bacterium]